MTRQSLAQKTLRPRKLQKLESIVKSLEGQVAALMRSHGQLREEADALRDSLVSSGALHPTRLLAGLHRRRFAEVIKQYPSLWPGCLDTIMQNRELALSIATFTGVASIKPLAAASPALRHGVGSFLVEHAALFPAQLYIVGGADEAGSALKCVERFDCTSSVWKPVASLLEARESCAVVASNAVLYAIGGVNDVGQCLATAECFSPQVGTWESIPSMHCARSVTSAVAISGQIYVMGGHNLFQSLDSAESYSTRTNTWQMSPPLRSARFGAAVATLGTQIFVMGGKAGGHCLSLVESFHINEGTWELMPSMHARRYRAAAATANGRIYSIGGCDDAWQIEVPSVECFDPENMVWHVVAPLNITRWGAAAVASRGSVFILGGRDIRDGGSALDSVERLDPYSGVWTSLPSLITTRKFCGAAACHD